MIFKPARASWPRQMAGLLGVGRHGAAQGRDYMRGADRCAVPARVRPISAIWFSARVQMAGDRGDIIAAAHYFATMATPALR